MQQLQSAIRGSIPVILVVERVGELGHVSENLSKCVGHLWEERTARNSKMLGEVQSSDLHSVAKKSEKFGCGLWACSVAPSR